MVVLRERPRGVPARIRVVRVQLLLQQLKRLGLWRLMVFVWFCNERHF
jgi:hypothetical protein